jgi:CarD family transcriptional regulator
VLRDDPTRMPKNWNRRLKHNREKIKTGEVLEIADVLRNLALRDAERGLSTGEKQMYGKVKHILASELMYAKQMREEEAACFLDGVLAEICAQTQCD